MGNITVKLSIGPINFPNYILIVARKVSDPNVEAARQSFGPNPSSVNVVFTQMDPITYYLDFRDSPDGVNIGTLISQYTIDAATNQIIAERRFYTCGGPNTGDPAVGGTTIVDPYFVDKNVSGVFKEGARYFKPTDEWTIAADTISVINGTTWADEEVITVEITYKQALPSDTVPGEFSGTKTITSSLTLDSSYRGKRSRIVSGGESVVEIQLEDISAMADGDTYFFQILGGVGIVMAELKTQDGQKIFFDGWRAAGVSLFDKIWIASGEWIKLEVLSGQFEVTSYHEGIVRVGEKVSARTNKQQNILEDNQALIDGAVYRRLHWWIWNVLGIDNCYVDDNVIVFPYPGTFANIFVAGQFIVHSDINEKRFKMPYGKGYMEKGLDAAGADGNYRIVNKIGGSELPLVGESSVTIGGGPRTSNTIFGLTDVFGEPAADQTFTINPGQVNTVKNQAVIFSTKY